MTRMRWSKNETAAMMVKNQSTSESTDPRTEAGSCGRGWGGGGVTNWNRIVMSASVILPRERSSSGSGQLAPFLWILPVCLSWASEMISLPTAIRASIPSEKLATYWLPLASKSNQLRGSASEGTTNMFFADCPMVMFSRLRTSRSSTMRPPWMIPIRRILGFGVEPTCACRAAAWVAIRQFLYRVGPGELCSTGPVAGGLGPSQGAIFLKRWSGNAVQYLRDEVLLQFLPVVVDARLLIEKERLRLLDLALDPDLVGDAVDLLTARPFFDLHLGRAVGGGWRGGRSRGRRRRWISRRRGDGLRARDFRGERQGDHRD